MNEPFPFTTVALPDGIVVGGPWPHTTVAWPGGKGRAATKPEYDLFQALEKRERAVEILRDELETVCSELTEVQQQNAAEMANPSLAINHSLNRVAAALKAAREALA